MNSYIIEQSDVYRFISKHIQILILILFFNIISLFHCPFIPSSFAFCFLSANNYLGWPRDLVSRLLSLLRYYEIVFQVNEQTFVCYFLNYIYNVIFNLFYDISWVTRASFSISCHITFELLSDFRLGTSL